MATWEHSTHTITRQEWRVPLRDGRCPYAEVLQAIHVAEVARADGLGKSIDKLSDDALMMSVDDDGILVWFETSEATR